MSEATIIETPEQSKLDDLLIVFGIVASNNNLGFKVARRLHGLKVGQVWIKPDVCEVGNVFQGDLRPASNSKQDHGGEESCSCHHGLEKVWTGEETLISTSLDQQTKIYGVQGIR